MPLVEPKILKGFRDLLPQSAIIKRDLIRKIENVFITHNFQPIETPALEYTEIILGNGSEESDKQMYRFKDQGDRDVSLRFDLTIPLARFAAMYANTLGLPFRRYHIAPVWRAEKPQKGRFREFFQCDFDIIGSRANASDAEILLTAHRAISTVETPFIIRVNNRKILNGLINSLGAENASKDVLRAIDKLEKQGEEIVRAELGTVLSPSAIEEILAFVKCTGTSNFELLEELSKKFSKIEELVGGCNELREILTLVNKPELKIDLTIARGLDYYTGLVFETNLTGIPEIGSVCSGGRYDNLTALYTKQDLPGVGGSVGLDRLITALELLKIETLEENKSILIAPLSPEDFEYAFNLTEELRSNNICCEIYLEPSKLANQLKYANKRNFSHVIIIGENERKTNSVTLKDLKTGTQLEHVKISDLI